MLIPRGSGGQWPLKVGGGDGPGLVGIPADAGARAADRLELALLDNRELGDADAVSVEDDSQGQHVVELIEAPQMLEREVLHILDDLAPGSLHADGRVVRCERPVNRRDDRSKGGTVGEWRRVVDVSAEDDRGLGVNELDAVVARVDILRGIRSR